MVAVLAWAYGSPPEYGVEQVGSKFNHLQRFFVGGLRKLSREAGCLDIDFDGTCSRFGKAF